MADDSRCVCKHSMAAHGLHGDPGCSFCSCRQFRRPALDETQIDLTRYASKALDLLAKSPQFKQTPKEALIGLVQDGHGRVYGEGAYLIRRNENSPMLHIILDGFVSLEAQPETATEKAVSEELGPGAIAGDLRAFSDQPRWADVNAENNVETLEIDASKLRSVFAQYPDLLMTLAQALAPYSASTEELVSATLDMAVEQFSAGAGDTEREGLDPAKAAEIRTRWQQLKEKDLADQQAREAARAAIDRQLHDHRKP